MAIRDKNRNASEKIEIAKSIASQAKKTRNFYEGIAAAFARVFRVFSSLVDRVFFSQKYLPIFSLILAILMYLSVTINEQNGIISTLSSSKTLNGVSVTAIYNTELYEVTGIPTNCQVVLTGDAANVNNAAAKNGACTINLDGYTEGTHTIKLSTSGYGDNVNTVVTPSEAQITLKKKTTGQYDLSYDFINTNKMDSKYILGDVSFGTNTKINIRASQDALDSIVLVKALIDVTGVNEDFTVNAPIVAYDKSGKRVNAEIVPNTISASVKVSSPSAVVPISLRVSGIAPVGYSLNSVKLDKQSATIYAPESVLNTIEEIYVNLDLSTIKAGDTKLAQAITLPSGVSGSDVSLVNMEVSMVETASKVLTNVPISSLNNENYGFSGVDAFYVDVTVSGAPAFIDSITADMVDVFVDVAGLGLGEHTAQLQIKPDSQKIYDLFKINESEIKYYMTFTMSRTEIQFTLIEG